MPPTGKTLLVDDEPAVDVAARLYLDRVNTQIAEFFP